MNFADLAKKTHIDLSFRGIDDYDIDVIIDVLERSDVLVELNLYSNKITLANDERFTTALAANESIRVLSLGGNQIGGEGGRRLASALKANVSLREIHLGENMIGDEGAKGFAEALIANRSLQMISLYGNGIGDEGAEALADAFDVNESIRVIWLHENCIGDVGGRKLAGALESNAGIGLLFLLGNRISPALTKTINELLRDPRRKTEELQSLLVRGGASAGGGGGDGGVNECEQGLDGALQQFYSWGNQITGLVEENMKTASQLLSPPASPSATGAVASPNEKLCAGDIGDRGSSLLSPRPSSSPSAPLTSPKAVKVRKEEDEEIISLKRALDEKDATIASLKKAIAAQEEELKAKAKEIDDLKPSGVDEDKDEKIASLMAVIENSAVKLIPTALAAKDKKIALLENGIDLLKDRMASEQETFDTTTSQMANEIKAAFKGRDEAIEAKDEAEAKLAAGVGKYMEAEAARSRAALEEKEREANEAIRAKERELEEKEREANEAIRAKEREIIANSAEHNSTIQALEESVQNAQALTMQLEATKAAELAAKGEIAEKEAKMICLEKLLSSTRADLEDAWKSLEELECPMKHLEMFILGKERRIMSLEAALADARNDDRLGNPALGDDDSAGSTIDRLLAKGGGTVTPPADVSRDGSEVHGTPEYLDASMGLARD